MLAGRGGRLKVCYNAIRYCYSLITYMKDSPANVPRKQVPSIIEEFQNTSTEATLVMKATLLTAHCLLENAAYGPRLGTSIRQDIS